MNTPDISKRGVYYNLELSPYEYKTSCGDILKFSSRKKLEIFTREVKQRIINAELNIDRIADVTGFEMRISKRMIQAIEQGVYKRMEQK